MGTIESLSPEEFHAVLETNLVGTWYGLRAVVRSMRRAGGGSIVIVNSTAPGRRAPALGILDEQMGPARALTDGGQRVRPGPDPREQLPSRDHRHASGLRPRHWRADRRDAAPIPGLASVDEISAYAVFLASEDASFSTGTELVADGGYMLGPVDRTRHRDCLSRSKATRRPYFDDLRTPLLGQRDCQELRVGSEDVAAGGSCWRSTSIAGTPT
jgi:3alpha(or 20beta)-hydroxysteroid dehydrogenase